MLDSKPVGHAERGRIRAMLDAARAERDREVRLRQAGARNLAVRWWAESKPADPQHPYLLRKGIGVHGARTSGGKLLIPMRDEGGELWNLQTIRFDSDKRFLAGACIRGLAARIGEEGDHARILLCEGWATGASLHEATGLPTYCAMTANNVVRVARWLRAKHPASTITICADNDAETAKKTGRNTGVEAARVAAMSIGGRLAIPPGNGDFNDYSTQLNGALAPTEDYFRDDRN
ncbi:MAG: toprim domain-containing protein [Rudaea sp.]|uniref:toprim domain-containing protein n=1 Tax=Rudaea sp. TaxID=2136325 RepID=UPI0039E61A3A